MEDTPRDDQSKNGDKEEFDYESLIRNMSSNDDENSDTSGKSNLDSNALSEILGEEPDRDDDGKTNETPQTGDGGEDIDGLFNELEVEAQKSVESEIEPDDDSTESADDDSGADNGEDDVPKLSVLDIEDSSDDYSSLLSSFGSDDSSTGADKVSMNSDEAVTNEAGPDKDGSDEAGSDEDGLDILDGMLDDEEKMEPSMENTDEHLAVNLDDGQT